MDIPLIVTEAFESDSEEARRRHLQQAVDAYLRLMLEQGEPLPGETP